MHITVTMKPFCKCKNAIRLEEISHLPDNWNGRGADKVSAEFLDYVEGILTGLDVEPDVFPTARDSIQLEYENPTGDYLEFEIFPDKRIKKFYCGNDGKTTTDFVSASQLNGMVNQFLRQLC